MLIKGSFEQLHFDGLMVMVLKLKNIKEVLLMVQKSHSQPPNHRLDGAKTRPKNNGRFQLPFPQ